MSPLLISALAMLISFAMAILPGPSGIAVMAAVDLAMFSPVQAIIFAEAGVKANPVRAAAMINRFIGKVLPWNATGFVAGQPAGFFREDGLCMLQCDELTAAGHRGPAALHRFGRSVILPVAISASQAALPRSGAWHR